MTEASVRNRRARHDYEILETLEVGLVLVGSEVKSIREGKAGLAGAYASFDDSGELWVVGMHVAEYPNARDNHDPLRRRKLLAHSREIHKLRRKVEEKGLTLIPLDIHFSGGVAKITLGLCRGRRSWDKREAIARREENRRIESTMKTRRD
jgi:SsrA-binding protein